MNQYILDFTDPARPRDQTTAKRWARRRMYQRFRRVFVMLSGLVCSITFVGLLRQRTQTQLLHEQYQARTLQYDSLLAAKMEVDRQLHQTRQQLLRQLEPVKNDR